MRSMAAIAGIALLSTCSVCEDPQLRARAVEMIEQSIRVTQPQMRPSQRYIPNETFVSFRATGADGVVREGTYSRFFAGKTGTRQEFSLGDFHGVRIDLSDRVAFIGPSVVPPELREMLRLLPMQVWRLDHEDIVNEIRHTTRKGVAVNCIEFDTINGAEHDANEICVDGKTGAQVYDRSGKMEVENSEFFDFQGAQQPGHISQYRNGMLLIDVQVKRRVVEGPVSEDMFTPPPEAAVGMRCETFQRAYGQSMPQPPATGALLTNIVVHAVIGVDGKVHEAAVESSERPDLNADAIKVVQGWTFTPSLCNGKPNPQEANLVVHFQGR